MRLKGHVVSYIQRSPPSSRNAVLYVIYEAYVGSNVVSIGSSLWRVAWPIIDVPALTLRIDTKANLKLTKYKNTLAMKLIYFDLQYPTLPVSLLMIF